METGRWRSRWAGWSGPRARDVLIVVLCALGTSTQAVVTWLQYGPAAAWLVIVPGAIGTAAMWWRRRHPLIVWAIAAATYPASQALLPLGFALLTIAIRRRDRVLIACTAVTALCLITPNPVKPVFDIATVVAGVLGALFWALWGAYVGARRDLVSSLRDRAARAEAERELRSEQARLGERARIAREMHDVLAHKVSLIALQAGGLEVNPGVGAERVEQTAGLIRSTAREALEELREVLGVMRADQPPGTTADHPQLTPQPGVADLPALAEHSRAAGVRVTLALQDLDWIPQATGRTVYRIVQEALTNVHKHARGAATDVSVTGSSTTGAAGEVRVRVTNQRPVSADTLLPGSGVGLIGLRERVALVGGTLTAGPTADGGWQVDARLPAAHKPSSGNTAAPTNLPVDQQGPAWLAS